MRKKTKGAKGVISRSATPMGLHLGHDESLRGWKRSPIAIAVAASAAVAVAAESVSTRSSVAL